MGFVGNKPLVCKENPSTCSCVPCFLKYQAASRKYDVFLNTGSPHNPYVCMLNSSPDVIPTSVPTAVTIRSGVGDPETNGCGDVDMSLFAKGLSCGAPLSQPCFDFGRCTTESIYIYDSGCSLLDSSTLLAQDGTQQVSASRMNNRYLERVLRNEAKDAGLLAETYESACIYVHAGYDEGACAVRSPQWNEGSHHLMINMSDKGR